MADPKPAPADDVLAALLAEPVKCCGCSCHRDERVLDLLTSLRTERDAAVEKNSRTLDTPRTLSCGHTYTLRTTACPDCFAELKAELRTARETNTRLNRRAQAYEAAIREKIEAGATERRTFGRILANGAAEMYRHHAEVMQKALVGCAVILESLAASVRWELAPEIMDDIRRALPGAREAVAHAPTLAHLTGLEERAKAAEAEVQRLTKDLRDVGTMSAAYCGALMPDRDVVTLTPEGLRAARLVKVDVRPRGGARLTLTDTTLGEHLASRDRLPSQRAGKPADATGTTPAAAPCEPKASASPPPASTGGRGGDPLAALAHLTDEQLAALKRPVAQEPDPEFERRLHQFRPGLDRLTNPLDFIGAASGERSPRAGTAGPMRDIQWLGCADTYLRLRDLYGPRFMMLGGPDTLYFLPNAPSAEGGAVVRRGSWIRERDGQPQIEPPPPRSSGTTASDSNPTGSEET